MEQAFTCAERFGEYNLGDGFESEPDVAPGAATMSACVIMRLAGTSLLPSNLAFDEKWVAGNFNPGTLDGWSVRLGVYAAAVFGVIAETGAGVAVYPIDDGTLSANRRPYGGKILVVHLVSDGGGLRVYFNGVPQPVVATANPTTANAGGRCSLGARSDGPGLALQPLSSSQDFPSTRNGVIGAAYGPFSMTQEDVAAHFLQIMQSSDVANGSDASGAPLAWTNVWSARRGFLPDDPTLQTWEDSAGTDPLSRFQVGVQTPTVVTAARHARYW